MKVFISMPMNGKTDEQIEQEFNAHKLQVEAEYPGCEVIDSILNDYEETTPIECLAKSLELMSEADIVFFAHDWQNARGCSVERHVAEVYGKAIKTESTYGN